MLNNDELGLIWFDYNDISFSKVEKILHEFNEINDIFDAEKVKNAKLDAIDKSLKDKLLSVNFENFKEKIEDELYKYGISAITFVSKTYPEKLKNIDNPPLVLYTKGDISLLNKKSISIVGTRKPSEIGRAHV